jgi:hypothetical protein
VESRKLIAVPLSIYGSLKGKSAEAAGIQIGDAFRQGYLLVHGRLPIRAAAKIYWRRHCKQEQRLYLQGDKTTGVIEWDLESTSLRLTEDEHQDLADIYRAFAGRKSSFQSGATLGGCYKMPTTGTSFEVCIARIATYLTAVQAEACAAPHYHAVSQESPMAVKLFRDEHGYGMQTEAPTETIFTHQFANLLSSLIETGTYDNHWRQVLKPWLEQAINICCAYRGYKVEDVEQRTLYSAGKRPLHMADPVHEIRDEAQVLAEALVQNGTAS